MSTTQQAVNPSTPDTSSAPKRRNGLGVAALVIGIVSIVGAFIPFVNFATGFIAFVGLVLGVIALFLKDRSKKSAIAGSIVSALALILSIVMSLVYTAMFATAVQTTIEDSEAAANVDVSLVYEVTGDSTDASVIYSTFTDGTSGTEQTTGQTLPFTKELTVKAGGDFDFSSFTLTGSNGSTGTDITCTITRDGEVISTQTSSGQYATAMCSSTD